MKKRNLDIYVKRRLEEELRDYPYKLMSTELEGLGGAIRPDIKVDKNRHPSNSIIMEIERKEIDRCRLRAIEFVLERLSDEAKKIIEECYFRDNLNSPEEVMKQLNIGRAKYYKIKKNALDKFAKTLGY